MSIIRNDMTGIYSLNQLNRNSSSLAKALKKVASGMKINSAADDASAYSISERMRVKMRGLEQCTANTKTGRNMVEIAEGAIDDQISIMRTLREIGLRSANGIYTDQDRAIMQKEVNQNLMQMNEISYGTMYNGKQLLNGVVPGIEVTTFNSNSAPQVNKLDVIPEQTNRHSVNGNLPCYAPPRYNMLNGRTIYDPNAPVYNPMNSLSSISTNSTVFDATGKTYSAFPDVNNNNVMSVTVNGVATPLVDANGVDSNGNPVKGFVPYSKSYAPFTSPPPVGTTIMMSPFGNNSHTYTYDVEPCTGDPIFFETDASGNLIDGYRSNYPIDFTGYKLPQDMDDEGFSVLCGACDQFVSVKFDASKKEGTGNYYKAVDGSEAFVIGISGVKNANDMATALLDGLAAATGQTAASPIQITGYHNVQLYLKTDSNGNITPYVTKEEQDLDMYNGFKGALETTGGRKPYQDFVIQGDTKSSAFTKMRFPNTTLDILFPTIDSNWEIEPSEKDYPDPWPSDYDGLSINEKKAKFRDEVWPYPKKGATLSGFCVSNQERALKFLDDVDQALKYLLHCSTTLGAEYKRLEYMEDNLVTGHENTTAAESRIRDADMAKEMSEFTKANVLQQSAQSMLSQSNQNLSNNINLLQ